MRLVAMGLITLGVLFLFAAAYIAGGAGSGESDSAREPTVTVVRDRPSFTVDEVIGLVAQDADEQFCDGAGSLYKDATYEVRTTYRGQGKWELVAWGSDPSRKDQWTFDERSGRAVALQAPNAEVHCFIRDLLPQ